MVSKLRRLTIIICNYNILCLCCRILFLDLILYGWAVLPFAYLLSFLFTVASSAYTWILVINIATGKYCSLPLLDARFDGSFTLRNAIASRSVVMLKLRLRCLRIFIAIAERIPIKSTAGHFRELLKLRVSCGLIIVFKITVKTFLLHFRKISRESHVE
jgi:hypothetical protein